MGLPAKNSLSDVIGLQNDIVFKVFTCPDCKTEVTISKYQALGELHIMCARCNSKYRPKDSYIQFVKNGMRAAPLAQPKPPTAATAPAPAPEASTSPAAGSAQAPNLPGAA